MARRRKGRDISGWLVIDKPAGLTSTAVVGKVRRALNARKAGHAGTLDPGATGVLAVALGEATKTVPFVADALKAYRFTVRWGADTTTDDADGAVIRRCPDRPDAAAIRAALPDFTGEIRQVPPQVSAVKVDGARAYDLARRGEAMELVARPLRVARLDLIDCPDADTAVLEMVCGKGGYVRAIARDLGRALGCLGHVEALRRVWSGPFAADRGLDPVHLEAAVGHPALEARLLPLEAALADLPEVATTEEGATRLRNGNPGRVVTAARYGDQVWVSHGGRAVAIGVYRGGVVHPSRVFAS